MYVCMPQDEESKLAQMSSKERTEYELAKQTKVWLSKAKSLTKSIMSADLEFSRKTTKFNGLKKQREYKWLPQNKLDAPKKAMSEVKVAF